MNQGIFRLVFSESRGLWMVADEHAKGHATGKNNTRANKRQFFKKSLKNCVWVVLLGLSTTILNLSLFNLSAQAAGNLPANTLPTGLTVKAGNISMSNPNASTLNVNQSSLKGIMQGTNFNIGSNAAVNFNHTAGSGSATLIRINGPKSVIEGALNSPNGAIHLINQNGILFANGARVNVNGLVASALDVKDDDFLSDLGHFNAYLDGGRAAYVWGGDKEGFETVLVQVEPNANIKAKFGSSVMMFAPKVINQGSIATTEGQVAMAAGGKVYISVAPDINTGTNVKDVYNYEKDSPYRALAGVLVEVDAYKEAATEATPEVDIKGEVVNDTMGRILSQRGNVTMAGFMVNQSGRVTATSSVNQKGSIRLLARDTLETNNGDVPVVKSDGSETQTLSNRLSEIQASGNNKLITASRTGKLTLGENSITTVLGEDTASLTKANQLFSTPQAGEPVASNGEATYKEKLINALNNYQVDDKGKAVLDGKGKPIVVTPPTISDDQVYNPATVEAIGRQVNIEDNAKVVVPGGFINISAQKNGAQFNPNNANISDPESRVYLGKNTLIDVAGLQNVEVDMERNFVKRLLTLTDLNDNSLNRDGFLYRKEVWFDIRNAPDSGVANLSGFISQVPRSLGEKLATAGSVKIKSEGDVIQRAGSKIDVSGGSLKFNSGTNKETWVVDAKGHAYALGNAPTHTLFTNFYGGSNSINQFESGYVEGKAAGEIGITTYKVALNGELKGAAIYGQRQREAENLGGQLSIDLMTPISMESLTNVNFGSNVLVDSINSAFDDRSSGNFRVLSPSLINSTELDASMLSNSGLESIWVNTLGNISVNQALKLQDGAKLSLTGNNIAINQNITARGGDLSFTSRFYQRATSQNITLANGVTLDVSGNWINDYKQSILPRLVIDGGSVALNSADEVTLNSKSLIDVSAGGWARQNGKIVQVADYGKAGEISIATQRGQGGNDNPYTYNAPQLNGELRGYGFASDGGKLSITAPFITLGATKFGQTDADKSREFLATPEFFSQFGFSEFNLKGRDGVVVKSSADIQLSAKNYVLNRNYAQFKTGSRLHNFARTKHLPDYLRSSTRLSLSTEDTDLNVPASAYAASGVTRGSVVVENGARIQVDSNGLVTHADGEAFGPEIAISAWDNQIYIDGTLKALGGDISLTMYGDPTSEHDNGYNDAQAIWLGNNARLLAGGYTQLVPNKNRTRKGEVYDGGNVSMVANKGYVVTESGAVIDVSGTSATLDIEDGNRSKPTLVGSNAGSVLVDAREGMLIDNQFIASAPSGLSGELEVRLGRGPSRVLGRLDAIYPGTAPSINNNFTGNLPDLQWYISMYQNGQFVPSGLKVGDSVQNSAAGLAKVSADRLMNAGFSKVSLNSEYGLKFSENVNFSTNRAIEINANLIEASAGANVKLNAPNVILGNIGSNEEQNRIRPIDAYGLLTPISGDALLNVNAQLIDIKGNVALSGFDKTQLASEGDIRLVGVSNPNVATGEARPIPSGALTTTGVLELDARQIFPTTLSQFNITVEGVGGTVTFNKINPSVDYDKVLSAAGSLTVNAETINQNGVLLAPFGTIKLNASDTLNLNAGSVTSVSGNGSLVPFGFTDRDGLDFKYDYGPFNAILKAPPERNIMLNGSNVNQNENSKIDISGGGDLFTYEWVPGIGGSQDVLVNGANQTLFGDHVTDTWAIMPANNQTFAGFDTQYWQGSTLKAGDAVYLSGMDGLPAGYYTLLPARYALLPGAMLVSKVSNNQDITGGFTGKFENGSSLVSGFTAAYTSNGYVQTDRTGGFIVRSGQDAYKLAQYNTTSASNYFKNIENVQQFNDAGRLSFAATNSIVLKGIIDSLPSAGGKGAEIDIAAPNLLVVADGETVGQISRDGTNFLAINESALNNFNAASLMLGGVREQTNASIISSNVRIGENANLKAPEILLAAKGKIELDDGASVVGEGQGATAKNLTIGAPNGEDGDGAFVRVSGGEYATLTRQNTDSNRGDLIVKSGAVVKGSKSLLLDATGKTEVNGNIDFDAGAGIGFTASRISLGQPDNDASVTDGFWVKKDQLDKYSSAESLYLTSRSVVDVFGDASFGNQNLNLHLQAAGIAGYQNASKTTTITTKNITLGNQQNVAFVSSPTLSNSDAPNLGTGALNIQSQATTLSNNVFRVAGYDQVNVVASQQQVASGNQQKALNVDGKLETSNKLIADKNLTLSTPKLSASNKADFTIESTNGELKVLGVSGVPAYLNSVTSQAASLNLRGVQVTVSDNATIDMRVGQTNIQATGATANDGVSLQNGARILAQGDTFTLNNQTVALSAGKVNIGAANGNIDLQQGTLINLSGAGGGDAGALTLSTPNGQLNVATNILATESKHTASVSIDAKKVENLSQTLSSLSGFSGMQSYRLRGGDFNLTNTETIKAHNIKVVADQGAININGHLDASGDKGGSVEVFAFNDLNVNAGAIIKANGTAATDSQAGSKGKGGDVLLSSESGIVKVAAPDANGNGGALIDVSGSSSGKVKATGGEVIFRAARTGDDVGNGVNVEATAPATVTGANRVLIEAVKKYNFNTIGSSQQTTIKNETNTFAANVESLMANYSKTRDGLSAVIAPGVDVFSDGDLTISSDWVLGNATSTASNYIASGGILTLHATGDLNINGNIDSEQYKSGNLISQYANTWSYRLIAGADASSINPEAVTIGNGNIVVRDNKFVRTGTGFIHAIAGDNIQLGTEDGAGAAIYTEGLPEAVTVAGRMGTPADFRLLVTNFNVNRELYAQGGGDVILSAGGNISGSKTKAETQDSRSWLFHAALGSNTVNPQVRWWSRYDRFTNGVGALGGGDISIKTSGNLSDLQIASATNGRMGGDLNEAPNLDNFVELGGGDIDVNVAGDISQTLLHVSKGEVDVHSNGNIDAAKFSLMDAKVKVEAANNVAIESVTNSTALQSGVSGATNKVLFYSYDDQTALNVNSLTGNISLSESGSAVAPASIHLVAAKGDINVDNITLYPSKTGNVTLLAGNDINLSKLTMSDIDPNSLPKISTANIKNAPMPDLTQYQGANAHSASLLHLEDNEPVRFYAGNNVTFKAQNPVILPKKVEVIAGNDIVDANLIVQNLKSSDVSILDAGNAIRYSDPDISGDEFLAIEAGVQVAGPGRLHMIANGDVDLGTSNGILSVGNKYNPYLTEQGADIYVLPGADAAANNYNAMITAYLDLSSIYSKTYLPLLTSYMQNYVNDASFTEEQSLAAFKSLSHEEQTEFISQVFFAELKTSGRNAINNQHDEFGDYSRAERAILTMFPNFTSNKSLVNQSGSIMKAFENIKNEDISHLGDLKLFYSQIRSERGGNIDLMVPGGYVNAGLAVSGGLAKADTDLGIVSLRGGEINAMVRNDFQVNQSRVFTLGGSDLMLYSALRNIDAGKGAKTASSTPPPVLRIVNGQVTYDYSAAVSGSGIAALTATGGKPGSVDLFAPYGEINAGEAGVRSAGNINLGAQVIVGADNIVAGGVTTGAPVASVSGLGVVAPLPADATGAGSQNSQFADAANQSASNESKEKSPSLISVEVVALGDESDTKPTANTIANDKENVKNKKKNEQL